MIPKTYSGVSEEGAALALVLQVCCTMHLGHWHQLMLSIGTTAKALPWA